MGSRHTTEVAYSVSCLFSVPSPLDDKNATLAPDLGSDHSATRGELIGRGSTSGRHDELKCLFCGIG